MLCLMYKMLDFVFIPPDYHGSGALSGTDPASFSKHEYEKHIRFNAEYVKFSKERLRLLDFLLRTTYSPSDNDVADEIYERGDENEAEEACSRACVQFAHRLLDHKVEILTFVFDRSVEVVTDLQAEVNALDEDENAFLEHELE